MDDNLEIKNAIIESARLTTEDRGLLSAWITLDYGGSAQSFGGFALYLPTSFTHSDPSGPNYAGLFIYRVMEIAGVSEWSRLVGKTIRVKADLSSVRAIGHIVKDDWFFPARDFEILKKKEAL